MCGKSAQYFERFHAFNIGAAGGDPILGAGLAWGLKEIQENTSQETKDKWIGQYADLHFIGKGFIRDAHGVTRRDEKRADAEVEKQLAYQRQQYAPLPPEKTAMGVDMNADVRDRRRRAALMGVSQLQTPSGPGVATGGQYSGVNG